MQKQLLSLVSLTIMVVLFFSCKITDLRPDGYAYANDIARAKQLIEEMGKAHQIDNWNNLETYNIIFEGEFYGFLGKRSNPFKEQKIEVSLNYIPNTNDGQLKILSGKEKNEIWGIQSGQTYYLDEKGKPIIKENKDMKFHIPTYQYFIEFPRRIQEATSIDYLGTKMIDGVKSEGIIASWNTVAPQKNLDQYIIWIDAESKRIIKIAYTIRNQFRFVSAEAYFQDYKNYGRIILPSRMPVKSNLSRKGYLNKISIKGFTPNKVSSSSLYPLGQR